MPGQIVVVGLGPGDPAARTRAADAALDAAERIVLRTGVHPGIEDLLVDPRVATCDDLYDRSSSFDEVYAAIADRVCRLAGAGAVVYAVPGHPRFGERSVALLLAEAERRGIAVVLTEAVSLLDAIALSVGRDPLAGEAQILDATELARIVDADPYAGGLLAVDPSRPLVVTQVFSGAMATATKFALSRLYPDDHPILVVRAAGVPGREAIADRPLFELDRYPVDHLTSLWIDPLPRLGALRSAATLQRIVARLRAPGGCPWDRAQTHQTLRRAVIEEAYETADAIDAGDPVNLAEELGDLLLQIALHAQLAEEAGTFTLEDVYEHISGKLLRRHPHVFGTAEATTATEVVTTWEAVKAAERSANGAAPKPDSPYARLPRSMPAFDKGVALVAPRKGSAVREVDPDTLERAGAAILSAIEAAVAAGVEPEQALTVALRRRFDRVDAVVSRSAGNGKESG